MLAFRVMAPLAYEFLPYGSARPIQSPLCADAAFQVPRAQRAAFLGRLDALSPSAELVHAGDRLVLVRSTGQTDELDQLAQGGVRLSLIDAGPFRSLDEAAALMRAWLERSWECHALEDGSGNSCFEFGGCHRRCWWRGAVGRCVLHLEHVDDGHTATPASPAVAWLRERVAADAALTSEDEPSPLILHGSLVSLDENHHYCGLRPD